MVLHPFLSLFKFSLPLIACSSCRMEHVGACSLRGPLTSVTILLAGGNSHTYLYEQVLELDDILPFDPFLSFFLPSVGLHTVGRVQKLGNISWIPYRVKLWIDLLNCVDPESPVAVRSVTRSGLSNSCTEVLRDCWAFSNRFIIRKLSISLIPTEDKSSRPSAKCRESIWH